MTALLSRVKSRLFIASHRRSTHLLEGAYASVYQGRSFDFDDLREYVPGDDVHDIDWKATARTGVPLVKRYLQTRRQDIVFVVDTGRGMSALAESGEIKSEIAIEAVGVLGYLGLRHGDAVGMVSRAGDRVRFLRPRSTEGGLESLLRRIQTESAPDAASSDLASLLAYAARSLTQRGIVVVVADDVTPSDSMAESARRLGSRHELLWVTVADLDLIRGNGTTAPIVDVDGESAIPELLRRDKGLAEDYRRAVAARVQAQREAYTRYRASWARIRARAEVVPVLIDMLQERARVGRR